MQISVWSRFRQWGSCIYHSLSLTCWLVGETYCPLTKYIKLRIARAPRTYRDACWDRWPMMAGKTFQAFPAHAQQAILLVWQESYIIDVVVTLFKALQRCHMSAKASEITANSTIFSTAFSALHISLLVTGIKPYEWMTPRNSCDARVWNENWWYIFIMSGVYMF